MTKKITLALSPKDAADSEFLKKEISAAIGIPLQRISGYSILKRSIDARSHTNGVQIIQLIDVFIDEHIQAQSSFNPKLKDVHNAPEVLIVGAGPAGMFAALKLISLGIKPVILERGKDVRSRRRDLANLNKQGIVNPESNYCFGEGGAGTYSDGKLYTRSTKRGDVGRLLNLFVHFGAAENILYDAHPHIGTNKLPQIITAMREAIKACGGQILFEKKLVDIRIKNGEIAGIITEDGTQIDVRALILANGHSARDIFELLHRKQVLIEAKAFALGVRIEHPQALIDTIQYHCAIRGDYLPPASYSLVAQAQGRGVFSFCMCPGGIIAPAATAPGEIVVNGWSPSKRNNPFANSGTVVTVDEKDFVQAGFTGPLAGMQFQAMVEKLAYKSGGSNGNTAPAQRLRDFATGQLSTTLPDCSYLPGVNSALLAETLPAAVNNSLKDAVQIFGKKMKGYLTNEALVVATESRTSSPVRIPRDKESLQHPEVRGLFPCGEGAGFAGGIISAGMDGEKCAEAAARMVLER
ncbi:MAG: FAD-dependent protein [Chitinophagaceae bacterium]